MPSPRLTVEEAFTRLQAALNVNAVAFEEVGGDVGFYVAGGKPAWWYATSLGRAVQVKPGKSPLPVCTIGIAAEALGWLVLGTLDVARAFKERSLAVEGDLSALGRFVACFDAAPE